MYFLLANANNDHAIMEHTKGKYCTVYHLLRILQYIAVVDYYCDSTDTITVQYYLLSV